MAGFKGTKTDNRKPSSIGRTMKGQGQIKMSPMAAALAAKMPGRKTGPGF